MQTEYNNSRKEASTKISFGQAKERHGERIGERILTITTSKGYNGGEIETSASVSLHYDGCMTHAFSFKGDKEGDFRNTLQKVPCKRVTEKSILAAHESAKAFFQATIEEALKHYEV